MKKIFLINLSVIVLFIADRLLKAVFVSKEIVGQFLFFEFHLFRNPNIAFGLPLFGNLLIAAIIIIIIGLVIYLGRLYLRKDFFNVFCLSLIIVGAFSNLLDRLHYNYVIDYLGAFGLGMFNLADAMIVTGITLIIAKHFLPRLFDKVGR